LSTSGGTYGRDGREHPQRARLHRGVLSNSGHPFVVTVETDHEEAFMRFMFLLYGDEPAEAALSADERAEIVRGHVVLGKSLRERGALVLAEALGGSDTATVVRPAGGIVTDGPFSEGREQIGGAYVVECADLDEALGYAKQVPVSPGLAVEIRPCVM
jgi:hypothetical protein